MWMEKKSIWDVSFWSRKKSRRFYRKEGGGKVHRREGGGKGRRDCLGVGSEIP